MVLSHVCRADVSLGKELITVCTYLVTHVPELWFSLIQGLAYLLISLSLFLSQAL